MSQFILEITSDDFFQTDAEKNFCNISKNHKTYNLLRKAASEKNLFGGFSIFAGGKVMIEKTQFMICERKPNLSSKYSLILPFMYT